MEKITLNGKQYDLLMVEKTEGKYDGFFKHGVVELLTLKRRGHYYSCSKFKSGGYSKLVLVPPVLYSA